jgi:lipoyl(octanoyl) transferase
VNDRLLEVIHAGRVPYGEALQWQRRLAQERIAGREEQDLLLLLEHPPVVTLGRSSHQSHLLRADGIDVFEVERGGDVTYHGPGQLVGYPILDLSRHRQDLHWYLRTLEQALIDALAELGIPAERNPGYTGVWTRQRKIASLGVHVKQWVTWHGFALNVTTDLGDFERIVPCGIPGVVMTSVAREAPPTSGIEERESGTEQYAVELWNDTVAAVTRCFARTFRLTVIDMSNRSLQRRRLTKASNRDVQHRGTHA